MTREEFHKEQMERKGYVCPCNPFDNPDVFFHRPLNTLCNGRDCPHYRRECLVTGRRRLSAQQSTSRRETD